uniref:Reverse transcriptase domain-containing protein n=1 Tax=Angiostrongylus cantonensis TaxID=6313 RepID=A0A0K0D4U8_ANGCA
MGGGQVSPPANKLHVHSGRAWQAIRQYNQYPRTKPSSPYAGMKNAKHSKTGLIPMTPKEHPILHRLVGRVRRGYERNPTQYVKILRELYKNFTTKISPFYNDINVDVKRGVRQGDTILPKLFTATLQNVMRTLEWDNMGVKIDGRQIYHLRFVVDIVLITPDISQAERMLVDFDKACGKIDLRLNLKKTMFMKDGLVSYAPFTLNETNTSECSSYVHLGREINMLNDLAPEFSRRKRGA